VDYLLEALLDWIGSNSDYRTEDIPAPIVRQMTAEELTREYYADAPSLMPADGVDDRVLALYAPEDGPEGTIYVLEAASIEAHEFYDPPEENPLFREILLHELVHHVQYQTGAAAKWSCPSGGEQEAYLLGGRYLKQRQVDDPIPNRNFWAHAYSRC
jgi:hypothetical protein